MSLREGHVQYGEPVSFGDSMLRSGTQGCEPTLGLFAQGFEACADTIFHDDLPSEWPNGPLCDGRKKAVNALRFGLLGGPNPCRGQEAPQSARCVETRTNARRRKHRVADALPPIDEFRAAANRRITSGDDDVEEDEDTEDEVDDIVAEPVETPPVVTTPVVTTPPVIALAPVA